MKVHMDVVFISASNECASIRIGVENASEKYFFNITQHYFHLPPFHRLKDTPNEVMDAINKSTRHKILYDHNDPDEPIIRELDSIDLMPFWNILPAKMVFFIRIIYVTYFY